MREYKIGYYLVEGGAVYYIVYRVYNLWLFKIKLPVVGAIESYERAQEKIKNITDAYKKTR